MRGLKSVNLAPRAPVAMSTFNSKQIDQILSENDSFLRAIQEFQSMGKISEVIE